MTTSIEEKKMIDSGKKIYDKFCMSILPKGIILCNPKANTLELFALLKEEGHDGILLREMMEEAINSLPDDVVRVRNSVLYKIQQRYVKL